MKRSTVMGLPLQLLFPEYTFVGQATVVKMINYTRNSFAAQATGMKGSPLLTPY
jgi:hypothetical protein